MARAGNYSRLQQMREQATYADAVAQLARARQAAVSAREKLTRLMGLTGRDAAYRLLVRLPDLPASPAQRPRSKRRRWRDGSTFARRSATPRAWRTRWAS